MSQYRVYGTPAKSADWGHWYLGTMEVDDEGLDLVAAHDRAAGQARCRLASIDGCDYACVWRCPDDYVPHAADVAEDAAHERLRVRWPDHPIAQAARALAD